MSSRGAKSAKAATDAYEPLSEAELQDFSHLFARAVVNKQPPWSQPVIPMVTFGVESRSEPCRTPQSVDVTRTGI